MAFTQEEISKLKSLGFTDAMVRTAIKAKDKEDTRAEAVAKLQVAQEETENLVKTAASEIRKTLGAINTTYNTNVVVTITSSGFDAKVVGVRKTASGHGRGARVSVDGCEYATARDACEALNIVVESRTQNRPDGASTTWRPWLDTLRKHYGAGAKVIG